MAFDPEQAAILRKIEELESRSAKLKYLLENGTAKRPLIIEFSGAPKSGKTRSINVLELFLKRNGIKAEVFTERASIAPIKTKGYLYFNVWVSCASLQGMLEALYRDLDVFILDRGIFDALVWNEWLEMTGRITKDEAQQLRQFFTMERWTQLVDLVFVLTCDPKVSIEREYADQLTTKRGTIMALKVLNSFLDESICVVPFEALRTDSGFVSDPKTISGFLETVKNSKAFSPRSDAEQNPNYLQPIPCAVLMYEEKILILRRKKPGHPLHDKYDVWAGGHVNQIDDGDDILLNTLHRELAEEVFIKESFGLNPEPIGLIRTIEAAFWRRLRCWGFQC